MSRLWRLVIRAKGLSPETVDCEVFEFRDYGVWVKGGWSPRIESGLGAGGRNKDFDQRVYPWEALISATLIGPVEH